MGKRKIRKECEIDAPIALVWELMTDLGGYSDWNPFVVSAASSGGGATVGALLDLTVRWHDGGESRSTEEVLVAKAPDAGGGAQEATWVYSYRSWMCTIGMVRSVRSQRLTQTNGASTTYVSEIELSGWGVGGVPFAKIDRGIQAQADALKAVAEARAGQG